MATIVAPAGFGDAAGRRPREDIGRGLLLERGEARIGGDFPNVRVRILEVAGVAAVEARLGGLDAYMITYLPLRVC